MRVLFVPMAGGGIAHLFPLVALHRQTSASDIKAAFLLQKDAWPAAAALSLDLVEVDHQHFLNGGFRSEMRAYHLFKPDVVVDDTGLSTAFAADLMKVPRVTIQRTGAFPGEALDDARHHHSLDFEMTDLPDVTLLGLSQPRTLADLFHGRRSIIPGIPSLEQLPPAVRKDPTYVFSGPLLLDDAEASRAVASLDGAASPQLNRSAPPTTDGETAKALIKFVDANQGRRRVFMTMGTVASASPPIVASLRHLLDRDMAVVSTINVDGLESEKANRYFFAHRLPLHTVCANVDLVIHHCGSGTYHYPLLHERPSLSIGTQCFDREQVALRLQERGVSFHLPSPEESPAFEEQFRQALDRSCSEDTAFRAERARQLAALKAELTKATAAFDFDTLLRRAAGR